MTQPGWKERPDAVGIYVRHDPGQKASRYGVWHVRNLESYGDHRNDKCKWYGPIPEDIPTPGATE